MQWATKNSHFSQLCLGIPHFIELIDGLGYTFPHSVGNDSVLIREQQLRCHEKLRGILHLPVH